MSFSSFFLKSLFGPGSFAPKIPLPFWRMSVQLATTALLARLQQLSSRVLQGLTTHRRGAAYSLTALPATQVNTK